MLPFYVQRVGIIAGTLNIEDNIHAKCGGYFAILANFITFYYIIPPFLAKIFKIFSLEFQKFCGNQSAVSKRQKGLASPGANGSW